MRDSEGFGRTFIDKEKDDGSTSTYKYNPKLVNNDIYVMVENYPY